jgi:hypothetical protein
MGQRFLKMKRSMIAVMSVVAVMAAAGPSLGTMITYTGETAFKTAIQPGYYQEDFNYAPWLALGNGIGPTTFGPSVNGWKYQLSCAGTNGLDGSPTPGGGGAVSTWWETSTINVAFTGPLPTAVGGIFWVTDPTGTFVSGGTVTLTLNGGGTYTYTDTSDYPAFTGFISDSPITSMTITPAGARRYATMDHFIVGTVPEPSTLVLLAGLVGMFALGYLRRK